ncbi:hypothetical protein JCM21900_000498 [Sporobolomyces salmonicolor]
MASSRSSSSLATAASTHPDRVAHAIELTERLSIRLQYAYFKLQHAWTRHSLSEVENLYFQPFADQAHQRRKTRRDDPKRAQRIERAIGADIEREEREQRSGRRDRWEGMEWYGPWRVESRMDREARMRARALGQRKVEDPPPMDETDSFDSDELSPALSVGGCWEDSGTQEGSRARGGRDSDYLLPHSQPSPHRPLSPFETARLSTSSQLITPSPDVTERMRKEEGERGEVDVSRVGWRAQVEGRNR